MVTSQTVSISKPMIGTRNRLSFRVFAVAGAAGFAGSLLYWHTSALIGGQPAWLVAGLLYATSIGLISAFIFRYLPKLGPFMELTAISRLLLGCISVVTPSFAVTLTTAPVLNATLVVSGAVLIRAITRTRWPLWTESGVHLRRERAAQIPRAL